MSLKEVKELAKDKELIPLVPITGYTNKPYCPWSNEEYWIKSPDGIKSDKFSWINSKGERKSSNITGFSLLTGSRSNITVIDLDMNHKDGTDGIASFETLIKDLSKEDINIINSTFRVKTPRGGIHVYFKYIEGIKNDSDLFKDIKLPGIDVRNDGGQVPIAFSKRKIEEKTLKYEVINNNDIQEMPQALKDLFLDKGSSSNGIDKFQLMDEDIFLPLRGMVEGDGRNNALNKLLFQYAKQHDLKDFLSISSVALNINTRYFAEPEENYLRTAESVYKKIKADCSKSDRDIKIVDFASSLKQSPIKEPGFLVQRLIYENCINLIVGDPKTFKTYMALDIAIGVITGAETLGHSVFKKGKVLMISAELDVRDRILSLIKGRKLDTNQFENKLFINDYQGSLDFFAWNKDKSKLENDIINLKPDLLILDPLSYIFDGEITDNDQVREFIKELKELIAKYKLTILLTHHNNRMKNTDRNGKISGSAAISRYVDSIIHLEKFDEEKQDINKTDEELDSEAKPIKLIKGDYRYGKTGYRYYSINFIFSQDKTNIVATKLELDDTIIKNIKTKKKDEKDVREDDILNRLILAINENKIDSGNMGIMIGEIMIIVNNKYDFKDGTYRKYLKKAIDVLINLEYVKLDGKKYYIKNRNIPSML